MAYLSDDQLRSRAANMRRLGQNLDLAAAYEAELETRVAESTDATLDLASMTVPVICDELARAYVAGQLQRAGACVQELRIRLANEHERKRVTRLAKKMKAGLDAWDTEESKS